MSFAESLDQFKVGYPKQPKDEGGISIIFQVPKEYFTPIPYTGSAIEVKDVKVE